MPQVRVKVLRVAGGWHLATYANSTTYFNHADWLGTERMRTGVSGTSCETVVSLAFGDGQATSGSCDPSPMHFTGRVSGFVLANPELKKMRDTETNLDDFDARYYSSQWGRFISADWSAVPEPVPYANLANPQTPNLYGMVSDSPETFDDVDGHVLQLADSQSWGALCAFAGADCSDFTPGADGKVAFRCGGPGQTGCDELNENAQELKSLIDNPGLFVFAGAVLGPDKYSYQIYQPTTVKVTASIVPIESGFVGRGYKISMPGLFIPMHSESAAKKPGCFSGVFLQSAATALDPLPTLPQGSDFGDAAKAAGTAAAVNRIVSRGLVVPLRSSYVRTALTIGEDASVAIPLAIGLYSSGKGLIDEARAIRSGTCQGF